MKNDDYELEIFLYKIIKELSKTNAPIVFKGGLALKDLLHHTNLNNTIERRTIDIDANWIGNEDLNEIIEVITKALKIVDSTCRIEVSRLPKENGSMGLKILDSLDNIISRIDLDIKNNPFYVICKVDNIKIKYSSFEKMLADKLYALSGAHVFRRAKDLLDIYLIIKDNDIKIEKIKEIWKYDSRTLDNFETMLSNKNIIKEGYDKLSGINNKPSFDDVWDKDIKFLVENKLINTKK